MSKPWISDKWFVSPYNFAPEAIAEMRIPEKVRIYDVTLRDGEQAPGVVFNRPDKVKIAQGLGEVGVHSLEAGMPVVSEEDFKAVKEIAHLGFETKVKAFSRARRDDIDLALKCDVWGVVIELPSSKLLIEKGYRWSEDRIREMSIDTSQYAKDHGLHVSFFGIDSTRADLNFLIDFFDTVVKEGRADAIVIVDTFGVASPWGLAYLVKKVKEKVKVPIELHNHNDLGLGVANSIAGVTAGAEVVQTNINGLGERSGGTALEETAIGLRLLCGIDLDIDYSKLYKLSKTVQELSGIKMSPIKPVIGDNAFGLEAGIAIMMYKRFKEDNYLQGCLPYLPDLVGNRAKIVVGKKSGRYSILEKMEELGIEATEDQAREILNKVKTEAIKKKRGLSDEEFLEIVRSTVED